MASDTSDAEEFYDAAEDVNLSPSPQVSPAKFVLPQSQGVENPVQAEASAPEPRHDDSLQIIDSIIEESQKGGGVEEDLLGGKEKSSTPSLSEPQVVPDLPAASSEPDVQQQDAPDTREAPPDGAQASRTETSPPPAPPPDITRALGTSAPGDEDVLDQVPLGDKPESDSSGPSKPPRQFTVEPDIVASTKKMPPSRPPPPGGAPPPRPPPPSRPSLPGSKKSQESLRPTRLEVSGQGSEEPCGLVSPNSSVRGLAKELQHSLDLASATSGDKVVTAQEILASVMIKNLDTGEEIPLNQAEEKLPAGINPLTLHIMRRTKEYITTQLKKFLGKSVKRAKHLAEEYGERAVNKVKSVRDEVFHSEQDEPSSSDDEGMPYTRPVKFKAAHGFKGPFDFDQIRVVQDLSGEHMLQILTDRLDSADEGETFWGEELNFEAGL
ncbi:WD repeat-containing protein 44 [Silurus meridionalis]|nr:WD repeat-containing protein 44 [Silurus meridionalis]